MAGIFDVTDAFADMMVQLVHVSYGAGSYVEGEWIEGGANVLAIEGAIQPATEAEKEVLLPEGSTDRDIMKVWTKEKLTTASKSNSTNADTITYGGKTFKVIAVEDWDYYGGFYKAFIQLEN